MNKILAVMLFCISITSYANSSNNTQTLHKWNDLVFKSNLEVNLHHFLHELARDEQYYRKVISNEDLSKEEAEALTKSVSLYKNKMDGGHIFFDVGEIPDMTSSVINRKVIDFDTSISKAFLSFEPIYARAYWAKHNLQNKQWMEELAPKLDMHGEQIKTKLEALFKSELITKDVHLVDVVFKPGTRQGAYTSGRSTHTIINSTIEYYRDWYSLEMIFHEVSHAVSFNKKGKIYTLIASTLKSHGLESEMGIWHPILFYTVGEVVKEAISEEVSNYVPYAIHKGLYKGAWRYEKILTEHWQPYIEGKVTIEAAIENIAKQLLKQRSASN